MEIAEFCRDALLAMTGDIGASGIHLCLRWQLREFLADAHLRDVRGDRQSLLLASVSRRRFQQGLECCREWSSGCRITASHCKSEAPDDVSLAILLLQKERHLGPFDHSCGLLEFEHGKVRLSHP